jgi:hypothetical protein
MFQRGIRSTNSRANQAALRRFEYMRILPSAVPSTATVTVRTPSLAGPTAQTLVKWRFTASEKRRSHYEMGMKLLFNHV